MTISELLVWLTGTGAVVLMSWIMENVQWFQEKTSHEKLYIQAGGAGLIALLAMIVTQYVPKETLEVLQPYFGTISSVIGMVITNQIAHKLDPNRK